MGTNLADEEAAAWTVAGLSDSQYLFRRNLPDSYKPGPVTGCPVLPMVREQQASGLVGKGGLSWLSCELKVVDHHSSKGFEKVRTL